MTQVARLQSFCTEVMFRQNEELSLCKFSDRHESSSYAGCWSCKPSLTGNASPSVEELMS